MAEKKITRRQALKYVGTGAVVIAAGAAGIYYLSKPSGVTNSTVPTNSTMTQASTSGPLTGGTLLIDWIANGQSCEPGYYWLEEDNDLLFMSYQPLVHFKENSTDIVPLLAESFTESQDRLTYTFNVRKGIQFSNGDPMNAYCFWFGLYRIGIQAATNVYAVSLGLGDNYWGRDGVTSALLNAWTNADNTPPADQVSQVTSPKSHIYCPDDYTLVIQLENVFRPFLALMTQPHAVAVSPHWINQNGGTLDGNPTDYLVHHTMGTGPYLLTDWETYTQTIWQKNPNYWGGPGNGAAYSAPPILDEISVKVVPDNLTRLEDLQRGTCQMSGISPDILPLALTSGFYNPQLGLTASVQYIPLNCARFPFNNPQIRNAVVRAIDYDGIISLYNGTAQKWMYPLPLQVPGSDPNIPLYQRDLTTANQLLSQAGYANGKNIPELKFLFQTDYPMAPRVAEIVQSNLADIGLNAVLVGMTASALNDLMFSSTDGTDPRHPEMLYNSWTWFAEPWAYADWFVTQFGIDNFGNLSWYTNPDIESLIKSSNAASTSDADRLLGYQKIHGIVYKDAPAIPVTQLQNSIPHGVPVLSNKVQGLAKQESGDNWIDFEHMYFVQ